MSSRSSRRSRAPWLVLLAIALFLVGVEVLERLVAPDEPTVREPIEVEPEMALVRPVVRAFDGEIIEIDFGVERQDPMRFPRNGVEIQRLIDCLQTDIDREIRARAQDEMADTFFRRMRRPPMQETVKQIHGRCMNRLSAATG